MKRASAQALVDDSRDAGEGAPKHTQPASTLCEKMLMLLLMLLSLLQLKLYIYV